MLEIATNRQPKLLSIANLFTALHENEIVYCNLKGNDRHLEYAMSGESDIDVLFDEKQKIKMEAILARLGFKKFVAVKQKQYKNIVDFITLDSESGKVIHLHTYYGLTIGEPYLKGYQLGFSSEILATRVFNKSFGLYCIQPAYELILLYLTESLKLRHRDLVRMRFKKKPTLSEKTTYQYNWLRKYTTDTEVEGLLETLFRDHEKIIRLFRSGFDRKLLQQLAPVLKKELSNCRLYPPVEALFLRWHREATLMLRRRFSGIRTRPLLAMRFNPRGGIVVAVAGEEGISEAFRSMVINLLVETFQIKLDVYKMRFVRKRKSDAHHGAVKGKGSFLPSFYHSVCRLLAAATTMRKIRCIQSAQRQGALVICDDHLPHEENKSGVTTDTSNSRNFILRAIAKLETIIHAQAAAYSPDLVFKLMNDKHHVETQINEVSPEDRCKTITVDAAQPLNVTLSSLKKEIWKRL